MGTAERFGQFSRLEAAGSSPSYARLARFVSESEPRLALLDGLEPDKRQPNLLFAAVRFLDGPINDVERFGRFVVGQWADLSELMSDRSTQTNEAARTATLLPLLARLQGPLTLIEVGASAGLCMYQDRYSISSDGSPPLTTSPVANPVTTSGAVPIPARLPTIAARIGIDLNPLDDNDAEDLAWLNACIWPEHQTRRERLAAAAAIVAADPPRLVRGDLVAQIDGVLDKVPAGTTPVVFHSAVLCYLDPHARAEFSPHGSADTSASYGSPTRRPVSSPTSAPTSPRRRTPTSSWPSTAQLPAGSATHTARGSAGRRDPGVTLASSVPRSEVWHQPPGRLRALPAIEGAPTRGLRTRYSRVSDVVSGWPGGSTRSRR